MGNGLTAEQQKAMARIIAQIAVKNGVTEAEVRRDITELIETAMANPDPIVRAQWEMCPRAGEIPTPEEFIFWTSGMVIRSTEPEPPLTKNSGWPIAGK